MAAKTESKKVENSVVNYLHIGKAVINLSFVPNKEVARKLEGALSLNVSSNSFQEGKDTLLGKVSAVKGIADDTVIKFITANESGEEVTTSDDSGKRVSWKAEKSEVTSQLEFSFATLKHACSCGVTWVLRPERGRKEGSSNGKPIDDPFETLEA